MIKTDKVQEKKIVSVCKTPLLKPYSGEVFPLRISFVSLCLLIYGIYGYSTNSHRVTRWPSWLRHCATNRKVASSIPDGVIRIFH